MVSDVDAEILHELIACAVQKPQPNTLYTIRFNGTWYEIKFNHLGELEWFGKVSEESNEKIKNR